MQDQRSVGGDRRTEGSKRDVNSSLRRLAGIAGSLERSAQLNLRAAQERQRADEVFGRALDSAVHRWDRRLDEHLSDGRSPRRRRLAAALRAAIAIAALAATAASVRVLLDAPGRPTVTWSTFAGATVPPNKGEIRIGRSVDAEGGSFRFTTRAAARAESDHAVTSELRRRVDGASCAGEAVACEPSYVIELSGDARLLDLNFTCGDGASGNANERRVVVSGFGVDQVGDDGSCASVQVAPSPTRGEDDPTEITVTRSSPIEVFHPGDSIAGLLTVTGRTVRPWAQHVGENWVLWTPPMKRVGPSVILSAVAGESTGQKVKPFRWFDRLERGVKLTAESRFQPISLGEWTGGFAADEDRWPDGYGHAFAYVDTVAAERREHGRQVAVVVLSVTASMVATYLAAAGARRPRTRSQRDHGQ